ncbi:PaaI family thioesterase [Desulfosporosinus sp. FKA]|uniref:PaaI family thioesterase n=1 Tax=Desulfosporosinus sp. FKA TaxID=1969834 RepID=UPI000B49A950|nr:PaaI family thioesterase [Desulfosporosinus sp. FKA]
MSISKTQMDLDVKNLGLEPDIFAKILELYRDNHYAHLTGIKIVAIGQGKFTAEMVVEKSNLNVVGTLHGGATATLIDVCMGMACFTKGVTVVTGNINISYLSPGRASNKILAVGQVIRSGKTVYFTEASLEDEKGQIIAKGTGTFFYKGNLLSE